MSRMAKYRRLAHNLLINHEYNEINALTVFNALMVGNHDEVLKLLDYRVININYKINPQERHVLTLR